MKTKAKRQKRTRSELRTIRRDRIRKTASLILLLLSIIPMTGGGVQPLWAIPAALCIAMHEAFYFSMAAGVIAGFGIDLACNTPLGVNAIYMAICCTALTLLFTQLLRRSFLNYIVSVGICAFLRAGLHYLLTAVIFRIEGRELLWQRILLPSTLLTLLTSVLVYILFLPCGRLLTAKVRSMDAAAIRHDW